MIFVVFFFFGTILLWQAEIEDWIFGITYVVEIMVRISGTKWAFFCDLSNWFDTSLVLLWMCELTLSHYLYVDAGLIRSLVAVRVT